MTLLFFLMLAGYAFGTAAAVLSPQGARRAPRGRDGGGGGRRGGTRPRARGLRQRGALRPRGARAPLGRGRPRLPARRAGRLVPGPRRARRHSVRHLRRRVLRGLRGPLLPAAPRRHAESLPPHHEPGPLRRQCADVPPDVGRHVAHVVLPRHDGDRRAGHDPRGRLVSRHDARRAGARARGLPAPRRRRDTTAFGDLRAAAAALSPATRNAVFLPGAPRASAPRRGSSRSTCGFRALIPRRRATSPR